MPAEMDAAEMDRLFATPLNDGAERTHLYLVGWRSRWPRGERIALWEGGPRVEIYMVREAEAGQQAEGVVCRVTVVITREQWQRWKRRNAAKVAA